MEELKAREGSWGQKKARDGMERDGMYKKVGKNLKKEKGDNIWV